MHLQHYGNDSLYSVKQEVVICTVSMCLDFKNCATVAHHHKKRNTPLSNTIQKVVLHNILETPDWSLHPIITINSVT